MLWILRRFLFRNSNFHHGLLELPGAGVNIISKLHFVIVDNGKELRLVNTGDGRVLLSNARRIGEAKVSRQRE
jgi:hypothetical protein